MMCRRSSSGAAAALAMCVAVATIPACSAPRQQGLIDKIPDARMGRHELRVRLREVAYEIIGHTKARSYKLYSTAQDSRARWNALQLAIRSNEMMIAAITHDDPVASLLDMWALIVQMRHFFESDTGHGLYREHADEIVAGTVLAEGQIVALAEELAGPERAERGRERIEAWALDHPLTAGMYRPSFTTEVVGLMPVQERNLFSIADTLDETVNRLSVRLEILNNQLPQQIAWQAGLLIEQRIGDVDFQALAEQSERVMTLVEELPQLVDAKQAEIFGQIDTQREEVFRQVDRQRADTLRRAEVIRDETLEEIDRQRVATIASLDTAIATALDRIHDESSLTVEQVQGIATVLVDDVNERVLMTVDRAFRRLLILVGVGLAGAAAIAAWSLRRPPQRHITEPR